METTPQENVDPLDNDTINEAAHTFQTTLPRVKAFASNMKAGGLGRVFNAIMEYPLMDKYPKFRTDAEQQLFIMALSCLTAKNAMFKGFQESRELADAAVKDAADAVSEAEKIMRASPEELEEIKKQKSDSSGGNNNG